MKSHRVIAVQVLDSNIVLSEFKLQLCYYVHFRTNTLGEMHELPYPPTIDQIVSLFFYKNGFSFRNPPKVNMPLKKKPNKECK